MTRFTVSVLAATLSLSVGGTAAHAKAPGGPMRTIKSITQNVRRFVGTHEDALVVLGIAAAGVVLVGGGYSLDQKHQRAYNDIMTAVTAKDLPKARELSLAYRADPPFLRTRALELSEKILVESATP